MDYILGKAPAPALDSWDAVLPWNSRPFLVADRTAAVQPEAGKLGLVAGNPDTISGEVSVRPAVIVEHPVADVQKNTPAPMLNPLDGMPQVQDESFYRNRMETLYTGRGYLIDYEV